MKLLGILTEIDRVSVKQCHSEPRATVGFLIFLLLTFGGSALGQSNHALKPAPSEAIQFVSRAGNDTNDGLSWGSAKLTIYAAYQTLPSKGCNFGPHCGGTIYLGDGVTWGGPVLGQGFRIIGAHDPNFASPPPGWIKERAVNIVCSGIGSWDSTAAAPSCNITGNSSSQPGIWISGDSAPMYFEGLHVGVGSIGLLLARDSNGVFENSAGVTNLTFRFCSFSESTSIPTNGPGVRIGPNSFELYFYDNVFDGNPKASAGSEARQAFVIDPGGAGNNDSGTIYIHNSHANSGAVEINDNGQGESGIGVDGLICEGQTDGKGCVWVPITNVNSGYNFSNILTSDAFPANVAVEVDGNGPPDAVVATGVNGAIGPMIVIGLDPVGTEHLMVTPDRQHQNGFLNGHILGQTDAARRGFSPVGVRYTNFAATSPSSWTTGSSAEVTPGITSPDGATGAGTCSSKSGSSNCYFFNARQSFAVGDIVVIGVWARARNAGGFSGSSVLGFATPFCGAGCAFEDIAGRPFSGFIHQYIAGDGSRGSPAAEWEWYWQVLKVMASNGSPQTQFVAPVDPAHPADYYGPMFLHITAGTLSDNEATELALNLQSYGSSCSVGTICGLPGQTEAPAHLGQMTANQFAGTAKLTNGKVTVIFPTPYQNPPICVANDTTSGSNGIKPTPAATEVVFSGSGTDSFAYICVGNPN